MPDERFAFAFDDRFRVALALSGVLPSTCSVTLTDGGRLVARFGPWRCETEIGNVADASVTGPYRWWRAVGPRFSFADRGATFGSTPAGGACITFREPVPALAPGGWLRHPGLTVTVAEPARFVERLRARAGLS
jgi:hypothetical protein